MARKKLFLIARESHILELDHSPPAGDTKCRDLIISTDVAVCSFKALAVAFKEELSVGTMFRLPATAHLFIHYNILDRKLVESPGERRSEDLVKLLRRFFFFFKELKTWHNIKCEM